MFGANEVISWVHLFLPLADLTKRTFELVEKSTQRRGKVQLADVNDNVDHITSVDKPLVNIVVDCLLGGLGGQQVNQTRTVDNCHL